jgi:hypothetical protein
MIFLQGLYELKTDGPDFSTELAYFFKQQDFDVLKTMKIYFLLILMTTSCASSVCKCGASSAKESAQVELKSKKESELDLKPQIKPNPLSNQRSGLEGEKQQQSEKAALLKL